MKRQSVEGSTSSAFRALLVGIAYGIAGSISGTFVSDFTRHVPIDWPGLLYELTIAAPAGAIVALILHFTKGFRERGIVPHYVSWIFACTVATLVLMLPLERSNGLWGISFALWGGFSAGIGLAAFARYVQGSR